MRFLPVFLFFSGFSALIYQTLWLRLLGLVFGVTVYAASTVLAAFMGGLALGSLLSGRVADRVKSPLRWFAAAEILIGASALSTPVVLDLLTNLYRTVHATVSTDLAVLTAVRFVASFAVLLIPSSLMGATMPLAVRAAVQAAPQLGARAATLYAANTAGALSGALAAGYYLISAIGIGWSFRVAALCNIAVGASAWMMSRQRESRMAEPPAGVVHDFSLSARTRLMVLGVFAVSGFVALALEIVWFRLLVLFVEATTYAFTTMLALVLAGIAGGSAVGHVLLRREKDWIVWLGALEVGTGVAAVASLAVPGRAFDMAGGQTAYVAALAVLPATCLMGIAFPVGLHCWGASGQDGRHTGGDVGRFYMTNLAGSIAGALAGGFLLIPRLGIRGALLLLAAMSLAAGLWLLALRFRARPIPVSAIAISGIAAFAAFAAAAPDPVQASLAARHPGERLLFHEEGAQATVTVHDQAGRRVLYLDGLHQTNDTPSLAPLHRLIGILGPALHPNPRDVLAIGLGGGATAGSASRFTEARIDVLELSPSVVAAAGWFAHINDDVMNRPNVRVRVDDGRNHLLLTRQTYDVVTADIIQPHHAGAGNLYSLEYFRLAARALREDGLMVQWIGLRPDAHYKLIARTFLEVFPHTTLWNGGTIMVGARQPLRLSLAAYRARLQTESFGRALSGAGIAGFGGLMTRYTAGPEELRQFVGAGGLLTDDKPLLEYFRSVRAETREVSLDGVAGDVERHLIP